MAAPPSPLITSREPTPPPLPPRPQNRALQLTARPTTALSIPTVQSFAQDNADASDHADSASLRSFLPAHEQPQTDVESMLGDVPADSHLWKTMAHDPNEALFPRDAAFDLAFDAEFDELDDFSPDGSNEGQPALLGPSHTLADVAAAV